MEIAEWRRAGVNLVVSLPGRQEIRGLGLQREAGFCQANGIEFISFPIPDHGVPRSGQDATRLARFLADVMRGGRSIAIHCRMGIGRSSLIAACVLICCRVEAEEALALITDARGLEIPETDEQRDWVRAFSLAVLTGPG
ncbi:MAG: protein-tyrosine phosphatase family protein [Stellaceae bacterium]